MSTNRRRSNKGKAKQLQAEAAKKASFWTGAAELPPAGRIAMAEDPSATLRSLGPPPLSGQANAVESIVLVAARAAGVATALAAAADILDFDPVDPSR